MTILPYCWFLLTLSVVCLGQSYPFIAPDIGFDCRRSGVTCSNDGDCDLNTGQCDCGSNATNVNYRCLDITESGTCDPPCENDGVCVNSVCVCGENYYGTSCEMQRVLVACEADEMFINVYPDENFNGLIYVKDYNSPGYDCSLAKGTGDPQFGEEGKIENAENMVGWRRAFPHDGDTCGNVTGEEKTDEETGTQYTSFARQFFVQYNQYFKSSVDQIITAECKVANGTATVYSDVNTITDSDSNYNQVNADDDVDTVTLQVQDQTGKEVTAPVVLGEEIRLVFTMLSGAGYPDLRLSRCLANNVNRTDPEYREILFLENGCPKDEAKAIFEKIPEKTTPVSNTSAITIIVTLKAFMLVGTSQKVAFECDIVFCKDDNIDDCKQPQCPGLSKNEEGTTEDNTGTDSGDEIVDGGTADGGTADGGTADGGTADGDTADGGTADGGTADDGGSNDTAPAGRRRREAGDRETLRGEIYVIDPLTQVKEIKETLANQEATECMEEPNIMAVVIILALVVVLLLIVLAVMLYRQSKTRTKTSETNMGYQPDRVPIETMRIPRLEINTSHNEAV